MTEDGQGMCLNLRFWKPSLKSGVFVNSSRKQGVLRCRSDLWQACRVEKSGKM